MYLRSARPRLVKLPTTLLLRILEYTVAAEWSGIIRLAGVNRRFRKIIHEYVWPEIKELRVRACMYVDNFDKIYINGSLMGGLIASETLEKNVFLFAFSRPSQKFKEFLSYFFSMAENVESIELDQTNTPYPPHQGLHHLFEHLRSNIILNARTVKQIALRFIVNNFAPYKTTVYDVFVRFINSGTGPFTLSLNDFKMLDSADPNVQLPHVTELIVMKFLNLGNIPKWRALFGKLPGLRRLIISWNYSMYFEDHNTRMVDYAVETMGSMFDAFQNAYEGKKTRIDFYFQINEDHDERIVMKKLSTLKPNRIVSWGNDCIIHIDKNDVEIRVCYTKSSFTNVVLKKYF